MRLLELRICNFRSYRKMQRFVFPQEPGLYFLFGDNQAEPRLEANAAGKSTIWDALCWLFFNKTSRGVRAGDVANWENPVGVTVALDYEINGHPYTAYRTWSPISWTLRYSENEYVDLDPKDPGNPLLGHLKLSYEPFLHSILMAQGRPMFLDLPAPEKASLFAQVLNLDEWMLYSGRAAALAVLEQEAIHASERDLSGLRGALRSIVEVDYSAEIADWEKTQDLLLYDETQAEQKLKDELATIRKTRGPILKNIEAIKAQKTQALLLLAVVKRGFRDLLDRQDVLMQDMSKTNGQMEVLLDQREYLQKHSECTHCMQEISRSHKDYQTKQLDFQKKTLEREIARWSDELSAVNESIGSKDKEHSKLEQQIDACQSEVDREDQKLHGFDNREKDIVRTLTSLVARISKLEKEHNPWSARANEHKDSREKTEAEIVRTVKDLEERQARLRRYQFWVRGFKELRLSLIAEALQQLEIEVNSCLTQLGLLDWKLLFDVDKESKSGNVQRGFTVLVLSPSNKTAVPWEAWSGGESQRLRLATTMGLANLIRSSTGTTLDLEVWDEPTQWISGQGVTDLLDSLSDRSRAFKKQIWIVDHRSLGYGAFDGTATAIKRESGTVIEQ